jgi:SP family general alpha glucoside:H+ symporter-like MFS transporter
VTKIIVPKMLSSNKWNCAGMTGLFFAGLSVLLILSMFFMLPETRYRAFAELDILFKNKVSAGNFHKTNVDQLSGRSTAVEFSDVSESASGDEKTGSVRRE